jgi:hypothetical protein
MYLLTMMGFSDEQLVQLLEFPISFRETGQYNRYPKIDLWLRKGALLALSREFSQKLKESKSFSRSLQPVAQIVATVRNHSAQRNGLRAEDLNGGDAPKRGPNSVSNQSQFSRPYVYGNDQAMANEMAKVAKDFNLFLTIHSMFTEVPFLF